MLHLHRGQLFQQCLNFAHHGFHMLCFQLHCCWSTLQLTTWSSISMRACKLSKALKQE